MTARPVAVPPTGAEAGPEGVLTALARVPGYPYLCASSLLWHTTRWGGLFLVTYLITSKAHSPVLAQLAGALLFIPMLVGGLAAGAISDRFERRRMVRGVQAALVPIELAMFFLVLSGHARVWMCLPYMLALGVGGLVNMTAQRPLIYEIAGPRLAPAAMAIEATAQAGSSMIGTLVGGLLVSHFGMAAGFAGMAVLLCGSLALLYRVPSPARQPAPVSVKRHAVRAQLAACAALVRGSRRLQGTLAVTIVMNMLCFGYLPLVPLVAERFSVGAALTGVLAAATGAGQILCGLTLSMLRIPRHGLVFAAGSGVALAGLIGFALAPTFDLAAAALFLGGLGQGCFAAMQGLLAIESAGDAQRGAVLGVLSTCIGALPAGMVLMGFEAAAVGIRPALTCSALAGLALLGCVLARLPQLLGPTRPRLTQLARSGRYAQCARHCPDPRPSPLRALIGATNLTRDRARRGAAKR
jgi:predicted MFS family arabinose efflux permease